MLFNSLPFLIFLPCVLLSYYLLPHKFRWILLLAASYFFYGFWKIEYLSLILFSTIADYSAARYIEANRKSSKRKLGLAVSLITNLGLLFFFKYSNWFLDDVIDPIGILNATAYESIQKNIQFVLPVGISFYTFQTLSYTIDVYHGKAKAETNPFKFALFVSYFPQLVAGPIERFNHLHKQLFANQAFDYQNIKHGARLILYGLFIKMCVADNISPTVDSVFNNIETTGSLNLFYGMLLFSIQIFSDFHGYSLIAIGTARLFGVELMDNFNSPYSALSIREFWTRWHISLSTWFKDYVFIPLGGSRVSNLKWMVNISIVFMVSGLWHGANWTFVIWGAIHGVFYLLEKFTLDKIKSNNAFVNFIKWSITISTVMLAWVFFRAESIDQASNYITLLFSGSGSVSGLNLKPIAISFIGIFLLSDLAFRGKGFHGWLEQQSTKVRWASYLFLIYSILTFAGTVQHPFIYFQF